MLNLKKGEYGFSDMVPWFFGEMGPWSVDNWH